MGEGATILDIGSGSGRDACYFQKHGLSGDGIGAVNASLQRRFRRFSQGTIVRSDIQHYQPDQQFDGIWACASFLHLQEKEILDFFRKIDWFLHDHGIIYLSGKNGISTGKSNDGRYFLEFTEQLAENILMTNERVKLEQLWYTEDVSGRKDFRWMNMIFKLMITD